MIMQYKYEDILNIRTNPNAIVSPNTLTHKGGIKKGHVSRKIIKFFQAQPYLTKVTFLTKVLIWYLNVQHNLLCKIYIN